MYNPVFHVAMESFSNLQLPLMDDFASLCGHHSSVPGPCWSQVRSILNSDSVPLPLALCFKTLLCFFRIVYTVKPTPIGPLTFHSPLLAFSFNMTQLSGGGEGGRVVERERYTYYLNTVYDVFICLEYFPYLRIFPNSVIPKYHIILCIKI